METNEKDELSPGQEGSNNSRKDQVGQQKDDISLNADKGDNAAGNAEQQAQQNEEHDDLTGDDQQGQAHKA